jgi:hypothetical protein
VRVRREGEALRAPPFARLCDALTATLRASRDAQGGRALELTTDGKGVLTLESDAPQIAAWAAALTRLVAITRQRHSYEQLYGGEGLAGHFSPRSRTVGTPRLRRLLLERQDRLVTAQQARILRHAGGGRSRANSRTDSATASGSSSSNTSELGSTPPDGRASPAELARPVSLLREREGEGEVVRPLGVPTGLHQAMREKYGYRPAQPIEVDGPAPSYRSRNH